MTLMMMIQHIMDIKTYKKPKIYMDIKQTMKEIYEINKKNGFWETPVEVGTRLMLVTSELAEALEADRKGRFTNVEQFKAAYPSATVFLKEQDDEYFKLVFLNTIKDRFEDEIADAVIRLFDMAEGMGIDLEFHIKQKMRYNNLRPYKHGKNY